MTPMPFPSNARDVKLIRSKGINLQTAVFGIDCHPDGKRLFASCFDGGIYEVTIESGQKRLLSKHESYASGVRLIDPNTLVSAGYDGTLRWIDINSGKETRKVAAHSFWSWKMRVSQDRKLISTVTGQYMVGGIKYEPAPEREPSVKIYQSGTGALIAEFPHLPPTLSTAFSPDSKYVAAANMMGEIRIWDIAAKKLVTTITTPDFTCWGIIKSHHYIGGIFDMTFSPDGNELLVCGMGPMIDPMAGNGKQTWQRFAWRENPSRKIGEIKDNETGKGLMESIRFHPDARSFVMAGKLAQGTWNIALFDSASGGKIHSIDSKIRVTDCVWMPDATTVAFSGATGQGKKTADGRYPDFGHIQLYKLTANS